ncbi:hypothetical protein SAMN05443637_13033 [Pseudonocardia thermophila]|jgi:hypothetical protein|uniref:Uncharacterized protein n=1 Tax=Pseudonocardia thermophila TaxID=1848 RepID=A0A1M7AVI3_PSETH|nr:hypothetical protein [Pseudonocardia thermophila]SHL46798.1 hypothetical protein SAMN05443637_13033 [Pseudonocardia thermophila]
MSDATDTAPRPLIVNWEVAYAYRLDGDTADRHAIVTIAADTAEEAKTRAAEDLALIPGLRILAAREGECPLWAL